MSDRAVVEASLEGVDNVVKGAGTVDKSFKNTKDSAEKAGKAGKAAATEWKGFGQQVDATIKGMSATAMIGGVLAGAVGTGVTVAVNYLREGAQAAGDFQQATTDLARRTGADLEKLRGDIDYVEREYHQAKDASMKFVDALAAVTHNGEAARRALTGMAAQAKATGRAVDQMAPIGIALAGLGIEDQAAALGKLYDIAKKLNTVGGPRALEETIAALGPQLTQVTAKTEDARIKLLAYIATMTKDLKPEQAKQVATTALENIKAKQTIIKLATGIDPLDKNHKIIAENVPKIFDALRKRVPHGDPLARQRLLGQLVGGEDVAAAVLGTDSAAADKTAAGASAKPPTYTKTEADLRKDMEIAEEQRKLKAGAEALKRADEARRAKEEFRGIIEEGFSQDGGGSGAGPSSSGGPSGSSGTGARPPDEDQNLMREQNRLLRSIDNNLKPPTTPTPINPNEPKPQ